MNIEPDAIETYQATTTLLLSFKLAEKQYPLRKPTSRTAQMWNNGQIERIAKKIKHTANSLASETKDEVLYETLDKIVQDKRYDKVVETLELTFNTMKRDKMI